MKNKKILIVEDEKPMSRALEVKFNHTPGFEAKVANNGQEALDILKKEKFDLILSDLIMPVIDGFTLIAKLKERGDKTPVIISSNLSQQGDIDRMKAMGVVDYFVKSDTPIIDVIGHAKKALGME